MASGNSPPICEAPPKIVLTPASEPSMTEVQSFMNGHGEFNGHGSNDPTDLDRIAALEEKTRLQDMEIIILKSALSDVLNRLATLSTNAPTTHSSAKKSATVSKLNGHSKPLLRSASENVIRVKNTTPAGSPSKQSQKPRSSTIGSSTHVAKKTTKTNSGSPPRTNGNRKSLELFDVHEDEVINDGKPKLILAPKRKTSTKRKSVSSDDGSSTAGTPMEEIVKFYIRGRGLRFYRPTIYEDANPTGAPPEETIKLNWVYGYRGKDSRDNLFLLQSGELAYNMAGVVVLHDHENKKQRHYTEHSDDVKCLALHPNLHVAASGQVAGHDAKPHVRVWDVNTLETLQSFGHDLFERGLCALEFSKETGNYLVCIDESNDHVAYLFDWEKGTKLSEMNGSKEALFSIRWMPGSDFNFLTYGKSHLAFWKVNAGEAGKFNLTKKFGVFEKITKPKYVTCAMYSSSRDTYSGDSNGNVLLFKEGESKISKAATAVHKGGVLSLTFVQEKEMIISGGKDLHFFTWTMELEKLSDLGTLNDQYGPPRCCLYHDSTGSFIIGTSRNCIVQMNNDWSEEQIIVQGHSEEMWGLATHPTKPIFVTCSQEHLVCVWDSEKQEIMWSHFIDDHAQSAEIHREESLILVGTKSGTVFILNYETKEELVALPVSRDIIDDIKVSPDSKHVAMACRDTCVYLYSWPKDITTFKKPKKLEGHSSRVLHLDWSSDSEFLQSNSGDYEVLFWHAESGCQVLSPAALRDIEWSTFTCPFGFPVMGIWPEGADGTDINTCCRSHKKDLVATGDDFGGVNLYKYPCTKLKSESRVGVGHSAHVTNVRFLSEDKGLITIGGNDTAIMQWSIAK